MKIPQKVGDIYEVQNFALKFLWC